MGWPVDKLEKQVLGWFMAFHNGFTESHFSVACQLDERQ